MQQENVHGEPAEAQETKQAAAVARVREFGEKLRGKYGTGSNALSETTMDGGGLHVARVMSNLTWAESNVSSFLGQGMNASDPDALFCDNADLVDENESESNFWRPHSMIDCRGGFLHMELVNCLEEGQGLDLLKEEMLPGPDVSSSSDLENFFAPFQVQSREVSSHGSIDTRFVPTAEMVGSSETHENFKTDDRAAFRSALHTLGGGRGIGSAGHHHLPKMMDMDEPKVGTLAWSRRRADRISPSPKEEDL